VFHEDTYRHECHESCQAYLLTMQLRDCCRTMRTITIAS
jgi:hypothetical protein